LGGCREGGALGGGLAGSGLLDAAPSESASEAHGSFSSDMLFCVQSHPVEIPPPLRATYE
jgi:hypothetical protein